MLRCKYLKGVVIKGVLWENGRKNGILWGNYLKEKLRVERIWCFVEEIRYRL